MLTLLTTALWAGAVAFAAHRFAVAWERVAALQVPPAPPGALTPRDAVVVPDDLLGVALQETETWAQEEVIRAIREKYELFGDWNRVRASFGVGRRD
jgi:hypothetical protein